MKDWAESCEKIDIKMIILSRSKCRRSKCCEAVSGGSVRKRCVTYDLIVYLSNKLCSSGEKIYIYLC